MLEEDRPPAHIWLDEEALAKHFAMVNARHEEKASGMQAVPDAGEEMPMAENEYVAALLRE